MSPSYNDSTTSMTDVQSATSISSATSFSSDVLQSDQELIAAGKALIREDKILAGLRLFRRVLDPKLLNNDKEIRYALQQGKEMEDFTEMASSDVSWKKSGWKRCSGIHAHEFDGIIYNRVKGSTMARIETPIERSLCVPLLAVLNETQLCSTWTPKLHFPFRFGIDETTKHYSAGMLDQICSVAIDLPWPMHQREMVMHGFASEDVAENDRFGIVFKCIAEHEHVPPPSKSIVRGSGLQGGFLFQPCRKDHEAVQRFQQKDPSNEPKLLVTFLMSVDGYVATFILNMIVRVAREVRDGIY
jgi:hypothetical protein